MRACITPLLCIAALGAVAAESPRFVATPEMRLPPLLEPAAIPAVETVRHFQFATDAEGWRPRPGMVVTQVATDGGALECRGTSATGFNYCVSPPVPVKPEQAYRVGVRLKVLSRVDGTPAPCMKVEFEGPVSGRINTPAWDPTRPDEWQLLQQVVRTPQGCNSVWFAIEKPGDKPCTIDVLIDDVKLERLDAESANAIDQRRLLSARLKGPVLGMRSTHPRLYLTDDLLRRGRDRSGPYAAIVDRILATADRGVRGGPPDYAKNLAKDRASGSDEQLWQRNVGNTIPHLALAYRLTDDRKYLDAAAAWMLAACAYPTWGLNRTDGMDLASGHELTGLGLGYDWLYAALTAEHRGAIRACLARRGGAMARALMNGEVWWRGSYLQNHQWVNCAGLCTAGLAVWDEVPEAAGWVTLAHQTFLQALEYLGDDGASHEGEPYWEYGCEYILRWAFLVRPLLGVDVFPGSPWLAQTASYCRHFTLPQAGWKEGMRVLDFADAPRYHWYGPDYILRGLAGAYRDGTAQWLAARQAEAGICADASGGYLNLVWFDPAVAEMPPDALPTTAWFRDMGYVSARSDWGPDATVVAMRCGPPTGHRVQREIKKGMGAGHVHPDCGAPLFFSRGEFLLRDDGYAHPKLTANHSALLVNGKGQYGENKAWFDDQFYMTIDGPTILTVDTDTSADRIVCDLTPAYPKEFGLTQYRRTLLYLKPDILVVADRVTAGQDVDLEWRWHPEARPTGQGAAYTARGKNVVLHVGLLLPADGHSEVRTFDIGREERSRTPRPVIVVRPAGKVRDATMLACFAAAGADADSGLDARLDSGGIEVRVGTVSRRVRVDWESPELLHAQ